MLKKLTFFCILALSLEAQGAVKGSGLHIRYNVESTIGAQTSHSTIDYYYQNGNFLAVIKSVEGAIDDILYLQKDGRRYSLLPKEKTYIEVKEFEASLSNFQPNTEGAFALTQAKKKFQGYRCDVYHKEARTGISDVCMSPQLYKNWKPLSHLIESAQTPIGALPGFPMEITTMTTDRKKQTSILMDSISQNDYRKKFEIPSGYRKKDTTDVQKSATQMLNEMPTNPPQSQKQLDQVEKMTDKAKKKFNK